MAEPTRRRAKAAMPMVSIDEFQDQAARDFQTSKPFSLWTRNPQKAGNFVKTKFCSIRVTVFVKPRGEINLCSFSRLLGESKSF